MSATRSITEIVREGILLAATEPNDWTNASLAADLGVEVHVSAGPGRASHAGLHRNCNSATTGARGSS